MKVKKIKRAKSENAIQKEIMEYLINKGFFCWRNNNTGLFDPIRGGFRRKGKYQLLGVSDILAIAPQDSINPGRFIAIEVKSKTGRPTDNQLEFIQNINKNGGLAFIARSIEDVEENLFLV